MTKRGVYSRVIFLPGVEPSFPYDWRIPGDSGEVRLEVILKSRLYSVQSRPGGTHVPTGSDVFCFGYRLFTPKSTLHTVKSPRTSDIPMDIPPASVYMYPCARCSILNIQQHSMQGASGMTNAISRSRTTASSHTHTHVCVAPFVTVRLVLVTISRFIPHHPIPPRRFPAQQQAWKEAALASCTAARMDVLSLVAVERML